MRGIRRPTLESRHSPWLRGLSGTLLPTVDHGEQGAIDSFGFIADRDPLKIALTSVEDVA